MNFCSIAYAILAYALGNMILIPVNSILLMSEFDALQVLLGTAIASVGVIALHETIKIMDEFQLTPGSL